MLARTDVEECSPPSENYSTLIVSESTSISDEDLRWDASRDEPDPLPATSSADDRMSGWLVVGLILVAIACSTIPWLWEGYAWAAWLGVACAMTLAVSRGMGSNFWITWLWCSTVLGAAFHWSPAAMAYTLSSDYAVGFAVAAPLFIWDGLRLALGFWLATKLTRDIRYYWFAAASTSIFLEYVMPGVFPWKLGLTQLSIPWLIQGVDLFGGSFATLVVFAIAGGIQISAVRFWRWFNSTFAHDSREQKIGASQSNVPRDSNHNSNRNNWMRLVRSPIILSICGIAVYNTIAWYYWSQVSEGSQKLRIGLVQVDPSFVESTESAREQTKAIAGQVDLICWPESSAGNYDLQLQSLANDDLNFQMSRAPERGLRPWPSPDCELLLGGKNYACDAEESSELYVTAMLIDKHENITARHNKRFLMPFGEYVPGEAYVPGMKQLFDMAEYVQPGKSALPIESSTGARIGAMLCYEDMVPQAAREMVVNGSNLLISLVNGSAFESRYTLYQHRLISHLRAIECRRYFARCAATGETCIINPLGEIESRLPVQANAALVGEVGLMKERSFYSRFPWLFPIAGCAGLVLFLLKRSRPE